MRQTTLNETAPTDHVIETLQQLQKGDVIRVDAINEPIRVHKNGEFLGDADIIEAYRESGARANIGIVNGEAWFDYSQLQGFDEQRDRMQRIEEATVIEGGGTG
ncbi:hypothetical protein HLRTI_001332 [Halorhabdus tiamatea SARL4B]|uniref:Uncharacterized protein n=1 Tax=Halorhabdus tiamatea SARL4B TaxID=1033806 RepID=F7PI31_9EURY|nr:hypothetical protein [Halorhabdus tiamatea]ERJ06626.1 hypothetical protein HLRTI_001332 [Halorhabdus tiamatea SARL4B]CCQ32220.1 hypothetical protein HTIA_0069 [Halorhabdus tiamatea SARL4B]